MRSTRVLPVSCFLAAALAIVAAAPSRSDHEFLKQPLGYPVKYFEPVDIEGDGIWELAVQVGSPMGDAVGVYSPLQRRWADGPHWLPIIGTNWGCGDFDRDGYTDYVYLVRDSVRVASPWNHTDRLVFSAGFIPRTLQVWGSTQSGHQIVWVSHFSFAMDEACSPEYPGQFCFAWGERSCTWLGYSLATGEIVWQRLGWLQKGRVCFADDERFEAYMCLYSHGGEFHHPGGLDSKYHVINAVDRGINELCSVTLPRYEPRSDFWVWIVDWWPAVKCLTLGGPKADGNPSIFWVLGTDRTGTSGWCETGLWQLGGSTTPTMGTADWYQDVDTMPAGLAYYDWDGDNHGELLLPRRDRAIWEIRNPQTGALLDSVIGMPPVDLRTAPIMEPGVLDLYYFKDSALYVLDRPGMPTGILEDVEAVPLPTAFTLRQNYPNPFNTSTVIEFDLPRPAFVTLEVFNILGEKLAVLLDQRLPAANRRMVWDGKDGEGQPVVSGIYFYRLCVDGASSTRKMILLK